MKKILIVNDVPSVNMLLAHNFESEGFSVDTALTGNEGLARARETRYDIILLDYKLPDIDGGRVCKAIKNGAGEPVPVYFISALDTQAMEEVIKEAGAEGFLDIAQDVETLVGTVKNLVGE